MISAKMIGNAALLLRLANFGPIRKARMQRGLEKRGAELVEKIKAVTPVDKGKLRASVRMVPAEKKPGIVIIAGGTAGTARGPHLDEALLTEYGTRREKAEPFFWPIVNGEEAPIREGLADDARGTD